jgi:UDP-N-acetylmuramyl pentapeptide synthase
VNKNKQIKISNSMNFLNKISNNTRLYSSAKIIGITGSAGKTSLKNLVAFALNKFGSTHSSPKSFNNHYGVPLSISNLKEKTKFGVFEIGMSKKGEINKLSNIVKPNVAVITNISAAHIENFKNLKDIAKEKSEIINNVSNFGNIILNKDDKFYNYLFKIAKLKNLNIISFSKKNKADVYLKKILKKKNIYSLIIFVNNKLYEINSKFVFQNYVENILSTISVLYALNLNIGKINQIFKKFSFP